jgi:hypothetical protein
VEREEECDHCDLDGYHFYDFIANWIYRNQSPYDSCAALYSNAR